MEMGISFKLKLVIRETTMSIIGKNNLKDICWLKKGLKIAGSVACIRRPDRYASATGFLIAPDLLLTNYHVLFDKDIAARSKAEFHYERDWSGALEPPKNYEFDLSQPSNFKTNKELDYAIVRVRDNPGELFGWVDLSIRSHKKPRRDTPLIIIQHPDGETKKIALYENKVKNPKTNNHDKKVHYTGDTYSGSSGSPVFDQEWNIVALHHGSDIKTEKEYKTNEGTLINSIIQHARESLGLPYFLYDIAFGELQSKLNGLINKGCSREDIPIVAEELIFAYSCFRLALEGWVKESQEADEFATLTAAKVGIAIGAAFRRRQLNLGDNAINLSPELDPLISEKLFAIMEHYQQSAKTPNEIYTGVLKDLDQSLVHPIVEKLKADIPRDKNGVAKAFVTGVLVGAKAFNANKTYMGA